MLYALLVSVRVFASPGWSRASPEAEKQFRADVAKVSSDAAAAWDEGHVALDADRLADAEAAFRKAISLAPDVDHPHRELCRVLAAANRLDDAVHECELAMSLAPASGYDKAALAKALLARGHGDDRPRAVTLAHEAAAALPDDAYAAEVDCVARALRQDVEDVSACVDHLLALAPDNLADRKSVV